MAVWSVRTKGMLIEVQKVEKSYGSGAAAVTALQATSLKVHPGEFIAILGASGSGKSTLMNIMGLLDRPSSGALLFDGLDCAKLGEDELARTRNRSIGLVFQSYHLLPRQTILDNVELPLLYAGFGRKDRRWKAVEALGSVGLARRISHLPAELSGGEQQRAAIARAIVMSPAVILADEPTGALDSATGQDIMRLLLALNRSGRTIVMVTHDLSIAKNASRIVTMSDGRLVNDSTWSDRRAGAFFGRLAGR
jgi:putative ABC transport system ATP-binding protein